MTIIPLSWIDLSLAAVLVILLAVLSQWMRLAIGRQLLIAGLRTAVQLLLVGLVLKTIFIYAQLGWVTVMALIMLAVAASEVLWRQKNPFAGLWGYGLGAGTMFISSFSVAILSLTVIIGPDPWYTPQYAIPLLGMMLGNTMTAVALSLDHLTTAALANRRTIESRLSLGQDSGTAIADLRRESIRIGLLPMINAMAAAGVVSLPGMMTGQIFSGTPPMEAVKYQILIMFLITGATGLGTILSVALGARRLFDERERLRLDRLRTD